MSNFNEQDFKRLINDKDFAFEMLMYNSHELLRSAYNLYSEEPNRMNEIINTISFAVEIHLNTKDKYKVIHALSTEIRSLPVLGIRNLYSLGSAKIVAFNNELDKALAYIEIKEEGKIQERAEILKKILPKNNSRIGFDTELSVERIKIVYNAFKGGNIIDKSTKYTDFSEVFRKSILPNSFQEVKWILLNRAGKPHKTALREFLTLALGKSPDQKTINSCFTDRQGHKILLAKPKINEFSNYYTFFEKLFKD